MIFDPEIKTLLVLTGGGADFPYQVEVVESIMNAGLIPDAIGTTSTGTLCGFVTTKKIFGVARSLCNELYANDANLINKPGIAELKNGRIKIDWLRALRDILFRKNKIVSLMDNDPLFQLLTKLDRIYPGYPIDLYYNVNDLITGENIEMCTRDRITSSERIRSLVASTSIPGIWPLQNGHMGDGGIREGTPLAAMFDRVGSGKKQIIVVSCNDDKMQSLDDLSRIDKIVGRAVSIAMNELQINDFARTNDRNRVGKAIMEHRNELPQAFLDKLVGYNYAPIYVIKYTGDTGTFEFTSEALAVLREHGKHDGADFLTNPEKYLTV